MWLIRWVLLPDWLFVYWLAALAEMALRDQHHCRWGWEPSGCSGRFPPPEGAMSLLLLEAGPPHPEHRWTASVWRKEHLYHLWLLNNHSIFGPKISTRFSGQRLFLFFFRNVRFKQLTKLQKIFKLKLKQKISKIITIIFDFSSKFTNFVFHNCFMVYIPL